MNILDIKNSIQNMFNQAVNSAGNVANSYIQNVAKPMAVGVPQVQQAIQPITQRIQQNAQYLAPRIQQNVIKPIQQIIPNYINQNVRTPQGQWFPNKIQLQGNLNDPNYWKNPQNKQVLSLFQNAIVGATNGPIDIGGEAGMGAKMANKFDIKEIKKLANQKELPSGLPQISAQSPTLPTDITIQAQRGVSPTVSQAGLYDTKPINDFLGTKYGTSLDKANKTQISEALNETKSFLPHSEQVYKKFTSPRGGLAFEKDPLVNRPSLFFGGDKQNAYTDGFVAILDKTKSSEIRNANIDAFRKSEINRQIRGGLNNAEATKYVDSKIADAIKTAETSYPDITKVIPQGKGTPAFIQGYTSGGYQGNFAILSDGQRQVKVNPDKLALLEKTFPNATPHITEIDKAITFVENGKIKALLMPVKSGDAFEVPATYKPSGISAPNPKPNTVLPEPFQSERLVAQQPIGDVKHTAMDSLNDPAYMAKLNAAKNSRTSVANKAISIPVDSLTPSIPQDFAKLTKEDISLTSGPIHAVQTPNGPLVLDGNHRLANAIRNGDKNINTIFFTPKEALQRYGSEIPNLAEKIGQQPLSVQPPVGESPQITAQTPPLSPTNEVTPVEAQKGVSPTAIQTPEGQLAALGYRPEDVAKLSPQEIKDAVDNQTPPFMNEKINPTQNTETSTIPPTNPAEGENPLTPRAENPSQPIIPLKESAKNALTEYSGNKQLVEQNAKVATELANVGVKGDLETRLFRDSIEHPENLSDNLKQVSNPTKFSKAVDAYKQFTDNLFNVYNRTATDKVGFIQDYYSHIIDTTDPAKAEALKEFIATKNPQGWFTKNRIFQNINELENAGFTLKNKSVAADILGYGKSVARSSSANAFIQEIQKDYPKEISVGGKPYGFKQLQYPGMEDIYVSPELYKEVKNTFNSNNLMDNAAVRIAAKANELDKSIKLAAGGFHAVKTTIRAATLTPQSIPGAIWDMISPQARTSTLEKAVSDGTVEAAGKLGITIGKGDVVNADSPLVQQISSKNPIQMLNDSLFGGLIRRYKLDLTRQIADKYDLTDPAQLKEARAVGAEINNWFGGLNYDVLNRNKEFQTAIKFIGLAPDFNEGKIRNLVSVADVRNWDAGHMFARKAMIGEAVAVGTLSYLAHAIADKKFSTDFKQIAQDFIQPNIPLPSQFNNPQTGKSQVAYIPGSTITDISKAFTDPGQFLQARGAALPALLTRLQTNKDYYDQTINQPGTPTGQAAWNLLKTDLPIPVVQGMKVASGKESLPAGLVNTAGLRVGNNPNDPLQVSQTAYYNAITQGQKQLQFNDVEMNKWNDLHPDKKDINGNIIFTPGVANTADKAMTYLNYSKMQQLEVYIAQNSPGLHDPIWDLPQDQRNMVLAAEAKLPGQSNNFSKTVSKLPWYQPFMNARSNFYNTLTQQQATQTPYQQQQTAQATALGSSGPLTAPPQSLYDTNKAEYFKQLDAYNNQKLGALGLPPLAYMGSSFGPKKITVKKTTVKGASPKSALIKMPKTKLGSIKGVKLTSAPAIKIKMPKTQTLKLTTPKAGKITRVKTKQMSGMPTRRAVYSPHMRA